MAVELSLLLGSSGGVLGVWLELGLQGGPVDDVDSASSSTFELVDMDAISTVISPSDNGGMV